MLIQSDSSSGPLLQNQKLKQTSMNSEPILVAVSTNRYAQILKIGNRNFDLLQSLGQSNEEVESAEMASIGWLIQRGGSASSQMNSSKCVRSHIACHARIKLVCYALMSLDSSSNLQMTNVRGTQSIPAFSART